MESPMCVLPVHTPSHWAWQHKMSASIVHQVNTALTTVWVCKIAQQVTFVTVECIYLLRTPPILQQNNAQQVIIAQQAACKRLSAHLELSKMVFKLPNVNHVLQVLIKGKVDKSHALAVPPTQTKITGIVQLDQFCQHPWLRDTTLYQEATSP